MPETFPLRSGLWPATGPPARGKGGVAPLNKGLSRSDWGLKWKGPSGPHRNVSEVSGMETGAVEVPA